MLPKYRLPVPCTLKQGESLPGFLSRAAHINSYGSMYSIANYFGLNASGFGVSKNQMRQLAKGDVNVTKLASFTESEPDEIRGAAVKFGRPIPGTASDDYVSFQRWRFCPLCVREKRPHQRLWLISFVTACPEHHCQLVDECHSCGSGYSNSHMLSRYCTSCQKPANVAAVSQQELRCSQVISELVDDKQELKKLLDRLMLGWFLTNPNSLRPHYKPSPQLRTVSEMRKVISRLWPVCEDESSFCQAVSNYRDQLSTKWQYLPHLSDVFKARARSLGAKIPRAPRGRPDLLLELPVDGWWAPIQEAAETCGLTAFVLKRLIRKRYVTSKNFNEQGPDKKRHKFLMVDLNSLNDFFVDLLQTAQPIEGKTKLTNIQHYPLDEIVHDALAGRLTLYHGSNLSLSDLWVLNRDTAKAKRKAIKPENALTSKQATEVINTYHAVIADLLKHGFLESHPASGTRKILITRDSLNNFKANYILVGNIAAEYGVNATNLAEKLSSLDIEPESNKTLVKLYQRKKLRGLNAETLESISSYETKTGRKPSFDQKAVKCKRVKRLIQLVNEHGGLSNFTRKFGGSQGTLSLMLREKKSFGNLAASRMENRVGLPAGWFDR